MSYLEQARNIAIKDQEEEEYRRLDREKRNRALEAERARLQQWVDEVLDDFATHPEITRDGRAILRKNGKIIGGLAVYWEDCIDVRNCTPGYYISWSGVDNGHSFEGRTTRGAIFEFTQYMSRHV